MNRHWVGRALRLGIAASVVLAAPVARAEGFFELYAGGAITVNSTLDQEASTSIGTVSESRTTGYGRSVSGGVRGGYWIDALPWLGVAGDLSAFGTKVDVKSSPTTFTVIPMSLLLMLRAPLFPASYAPHGRLQPYVAAGPSLFFSIAETDRVVIDGVDLNATFGLGKFSDTSADLGPDVRAGLKVITAENFGIFVEYRFTKFDPKYKDSGFLPVIGLPADVTIDPRRIDTHHVMIGVSLGF